MTPSPPRHDRARRPAVTDAAADLAALMASARREQDAGRPRAAEQACREALGLAPDDTEALHLLGVLAQAGPPQEAALLIAQAVALRPGEAACLVQPRRGAPCARRAQRGTGLSAPGARARPRARRGPPQSGPGPAGARPAWRGRGELSAGAGARADAGRRRARARRSADAPGPARRGAGGGAGGLLCAGSATRVAAAGAVDRRQGPAWSSPRRRVSPGIAARPAKRVR